VLQTLKDYPSFSKLHMPFGFCDFSRSPGSSV